MGSPLPHRAHARNIQLHTAGFLIDADTADAHYFVTDFRIESEASNVAALIPAVADLD